MKKIYLALVLTISSCCAQKITTLDAKNDFQGSDLLYSQKWIGGAPGSGSGSTLYFPTSIFSGEEFIAIYFRNAVSENYNYTADDRMIAVVRFRNGANEPKNLNMDIDPVNEMSNKVPDFSKLPVALKENQALIALKGAKKDEVKYILLDNIKEKSMDLLPSMPQ